MRRLLRLTPFLFNATLLLHGGYAFGRLHEWAASWLRRPLRFSPATRYNAPSNDILELHSFHEEAGKENAVIDLLRCSQA